MSTELENAKGGPRVFTLTSNDVTSIIDTANLDQPIDIMDITLPTKLPKQIKYLLTISYYLEIEIPSPAESNLFETVFIQATLDPTNALFVDGVDCHPTGGPPVSGMTRGVSFGNNFGLNTQRYRGAHSFTWVEKVTAGKHKIFMRASYHSVLVALHQQRKIKSPRSSRERWWCKPFPFDEEVKATNALLPHPVAR